MSNGPLPSKLTLLSSLPSHEHGEKVRFLGCVTSYSTTSAELTLQHKFPKINEVKAFVDVRLLLEKLTAEQTCVGHWLNVIGYIASSSTFSVKKQHNLKLESPTVHVQALMLWSAGPLDIGRYETCVADVAEKGTPKAKRRKTNPS